jgi:hypothetical protein
MTLPCMSIIVVGSVKSPKAACSKYSGIDSSAAEIDPSVVTLEFFTRSANLVTSQFVHPQSHLSMNKKHY